jgi:hypothetical protein
VPFAHWLLSPAVHAEPFAWAATQWLTALQ